MMNLILTVLFGAFGYARFRKGQIGLGFLWLCTGGLCGIGWIYDICIAYKNYKSNSNHTKRTAHTAPPMSMKNRSIINATKTAQKSTNFLHSYICIDLETTGLSNQWAEIIEIGAVKVNNGKIYDTFNTLVCPSKPVPEKITEITDITNSMLDGQPSINKVLPAFLEYIHGYTLVGHNIDFDSGFLSVASHKSLFLLRRLENAACLVCPCEFLSPHFYDLLVIPPFSSLLNAF